MEKRIRRLALVRRLGQFLLEKDLKGYHLLLSPPAGPLAEFKLIIEDTEEFGQILVSFSFLPQKQKNVETFLELIMNSEFIGAIITIHGHREKKDKRFSTFKGKISYNNIDYGYDQEINKIWREIGQNIAGILSEDKNTTIKELVKTHLKTRQKQPTVA
jgi:hypothetical protein